MRQPWTALAAWEFVTTLLASPGLAVLVPTHRHADVAGDVILELPHLAGNLLHDAHTAILMREHGIRRICTRDTDFHQFAFWRSLIRSGLSDCSLAVTPIFGTGCRCDNWPERVDPFRTGPPMPTSHYLRRLFKKPAYIPLASK
jgi:hypothetical protein